MTATRAYAWPRVPMVVINAGTDAADGADLAGAVGMRMPCGAYHLPDRAITEGQVVGLRWEDAAVATALAWGPQPLSVALMAAALITPTCLDQEDTTHD